MLPKKNYNLRAFFANCRELPERAFRKNIHILTIFALVKYRVYRVIIVLIP